MEHTLQIHPSEVNSALLCELRLDEDLAEDEPNPDMFRGSITHHLIEKDLLGEVGYPNQFIEERLLEEYGYEGFKGAGLPMKKWDMLIGQAVEAYAEWAVEVKPKLDFDDNSLIEFELNEFIGTRSFGEQTYVIELVGSPDLITDMRIHDWKTAARMWDPIKVTGQAQPPLYSHLANGGPMPFTFWIWDMSHSEWHHLSVTPTQSQINECIETAVKVAIKREMGLLSATPGVPGFGKTRGWWCSPKYCRNWNKCRARHMTNDGNEDTTRDWREEWAM